MTSAVARRASHDPILELAMTLEALDVSLTLSRATAKRGEHNRLRLLMVHGAAAMIIAPLFLAYSIANGLASPSWALLRTIPGAPHTVAAWLFVGGAVVMLGSAARSRPVAATGLAMMGVWYLSFATTFSYAAIQWWLSGAESAQMPGIYAGPVYLHLAIIMVLQVIAALRTERVRAP